jgi:hypothetical protein
MRKIWMGVAALVVEGLALAWQVGEHACDWLSRGLIGSP